MGLGLDVSHALPFLQPSHPSEYYLFRKLRFQDHTAHLGYSLVVQRLPYRGLDQVHRDSHFRLSIGFVTSLALNDLSAFQLAMTVRMYSTQLLGGHIRPLALRILHDHLELQGLLPSQAQHICY